MKAVVFLGEAQIEIMNWPDPQPGPDEVVIGIRASGMCGTDLHHLHAPRKRDSDLVVEGHEPCGVVVAVGTGVLPQQASLGDRVLTHHYDGCRVCHQCRSGWTQLCKDGFAYGNQADGGHAPFMKVAAHTIIKMPERLSFKAGAAISCGTGTAYGALKRLNLGGDETIAIFGQGPVGLSGTQFAKAMGARVIAVDVSADRLSLAAQLGADVLIDASQDDPVSAIRDVTRRGEGADKTMECSSNRDARRHAVQSLRRWGVACMVGVNGTFEIDVAETILQMKTITGSWTFSKNLLDDCANFVVERNIDVEAVFTHEFTIDQAREAYALFDAKQMGKGVFVFD